MSRHSHTSTPADVGVGPNDDATAALVEALIVEMRERWDLGARPRTEDLLARHPELAGRPEAAVELIYEEICLRQQHATGPTPSELFSRFPQWRGQLEVLLDCHRLLGETRATFPQAGEILGEFQLLSELGRGARGRVFLARQPALADRTVVLKLAAAEGQEHLSLARMQHTHIVPLYGVHDFPERNLRGLCMPYFGGVTFDKLFAALTAYTPSQLDGHHLLDALRRLSTESSASIAGVNGSGSGVEPNEPSPPASDASVCELLARWSYVETVCWLTALLADALHYAHQRGLLHLDLKPSNVLLAADGQPMLLDFHLARAPLEKGAAAPEWLGGTPGYISPELAEAFEAVRAGSTVAVGIDGRADIYSLGRLLLEALAGALPPADAPPAIEVWLRRRNPRVSVALADLVAKCLAHDPRDRYLDASHLAADLRRHLADQPLRGVANRSLTERWRKWRRRRPHALTLAALSLVVVGALTLSIVQHRQERRKAELALDEGREQLEGRDYAAALGTFRRGMELAENLPFCGDLVNSLREDLRQAQRAVAAGELFHVTDRLRATFGADSPTSAQSRELEGHCRRFWEQRHLIAERIAGYPSAEFERQIETDLLDLAILWADLRVRLAAGDDVARARREALAILDEAETFAGPSAVVDLERQIHAAALGMGEAVLDARHHAVERAPRSAWEHFALGRALLRLGRLDEAAAQFETAIDLEPRALWTNCYQGKCAYERGRFTDAAIAFTACAVLAPDSGWCFYNRGLAFAKQGDTERAHRDFDRAMKLDPGLAREIEELRNQ